MINNRLNHIFVITGLTGNYKQISSSQISISWTEETGDASSSDSFFDYTVSVDGTQVAEVTCKQPDCVATISEVASGAVIIVARSDDPDIYWKNSVSLDDIPGEFDIIKSYDIY